MAITKKAGGIRWVSECCLAETTTTRPTTYGLPDSPPDPVVICNQCGRKCEEWGLTYNELRHEQKLRRMKRVR
jgi:hypothetical protein